MFFEKSQPRTNRISKAEKLAFTLKTTLEIVVMSLWFCCISCHTAKYNKINREKGGKMPYICT
ncbi:MAG: hypothetical protein DBY24_07730 [Prevotellaceae bacterium]|nr:MAG: hypothetical protein DBY24_07730 [Prevotellaceae bacterium]